MANGAGAVPSGGMGALFKNPLFLQYLAGAGGAISQGKPAAGALADITQQNIAAGSKAKLQNKYMQMLQQMLAGGAKATFDKDNFSIKGPSAALAGDDTENEMSLGLPESNLLNPLASPSDAGVDQIGQGITDASIFADIAPSDLAGLTTQDVSQALTGAVSTQQLKSNVAYTQALIKQAEVGSQLDQPFPVDVPGVGQVTQRQWNALPTDDKEYALFVQTSKRLGDTDIMSKQEYEQLDPTEKEKFLRAAMEDPKLMSAAKELAKSGATRITLGEKLEEAEAKADIKAKKYFTSPKGLAQDVDKYINTEEVQNKLFALDESQRGRETINEKRDFIKGKITGSGGQIVDVEAEGRTVIWKVKWPDGKTTEVKYAF